MYQRGSRSTRRRGRVGSHCPGLKFLKQERKKNVRSKNTKRNKMDGSEEVKRVQTEEKDNKKILKN